jgi:hypothetical protein
VRFWREGGRALLRGAARAADSERGAKGAALGGVELAVTTTLGGAHVLDVPRALQSLLANAAAADARRGHGGGVRARGGGGRRAGGDPAWNVLAQPSRRAASCEQLAVSAATARAFMATLWSRERGALAPHPLLTQEMSAADLRRDHLT